MDERDQEKAFERLLAHALRASLEAGGAECPGPDILAAYLDRSLGDAEAARWELHFSSCAQCQQALASADAATVQAPIDERQVTMAAFVDVAGRVAPGTLRGAQVESEPRRRRPNWRWLAPAVGVAAAVVLWVTVGPMLRHNESPIAKRPAVEAPREIAQNTQLPSPAAEAPSSATAEIKEKLSATAPSGTALAEKVAPSSSQTAGQRDAPRQLSAATAKTERGLKTLSAGTGAPENATAGESQDALRAKKGEPGLAAQAREADRTAAAQFKTGEPAAIAGAPGRAEIGAAAKAQSLEVVSPPAAPGAEAMARRPETRAAPRAMMARSGEALAPGTRVIPSPQPSVLWRAGPGGRIERSRDAGRTWQAQASNVTADLLAGSAPSEMVCWVVGRAGTILRTTDGESWQRVSSPAAADWILVKAQDALNAMVFAANRQGYVTTDGGNSWRGPLEK